MLCICSRTGFDFTFATEYSCWLPSYILLIAPFEPGASAGVRRKTLTTPKECFKNQDLPQMIADILGLTAMPTVVLSVLSVHLC
jgi:hypothetical protein